MASHQKEIGKAHMFVMPLVTRHSRLPVIVLYIRFPSLAQSPFHCHLKSFLISISARVRQPPQAADFGCHKRDENH